MNNTEIITIAKMIENGMYLHLIGMAVIFVLAIFIINAVGGKKTGASDGPAAAVSSHSSIDPKTGNMPAITAAITAAVKEYKKNN